MAGIDLPDILVLVISAEDAVGAVAKHPYQCPIARKVRREVAMPYDGVTRKPFAVGRATYVPQADAIAFMDDFDKHGPRYPDRVGYPRTVTFHRRHPRP